MSKHSKQKNTQMFFTRHERDGLTLGSKKQRLGKDSQKDVDACHLCLHPAVQPLMCPQGHLFCRECVFENLLAQKKTNKRRQKVYLEQQTRFAEEEAAQRILSERTRVEEFEKREASLLPTKAKVFTKVRPDDAFSGEPEGDMSADYVTKMKMRDKRKREEQSKGLNNFWLPSKTPSAAADIIAKPDTATRCPADMKMKLKLKDLIEVHFSHPPHADTSASAVQTGRHICPFCMKHITNAVTVVCLKSCGHLLCQGCVDRMEKVGETECAACGAVFGRDDVVTLPRGGTGFVAHDEQTEAKRVLPVAFM